MFLDLGLNLCLLHWQADSLPLSHQGSPNFLLSFNGVICPFSLLGFWLFFFFFPWVHWVFIVVHWVCRHRCPAACGILVPRPGIKSVSPALTDGFLTTASPGKTFRNCMCVLLSHVQFCDPMDYSPPGSSANRISQARILE